nr:hypothetical protein [Tanacetum cinerariifolium]
MRIERYFLMTAYSLWEVILNGDSPIPTNVFDGVVQPVAPTSAEKRLARKNVLKTRGTLLTALTESICYRCTFDVQQMSRYGSSSTPISSSRTLRNVECSNCKHLLDKITVLEATVDMYMHPEQHTVNSAAPFHEVYNNIGKLDLK